MSISFNRQLLIALSGHNSQSCTIYFLKWTIIPRFKR